jgi:hypothetical protein
MMGWIGRVLGTDKGIEKSVEIAGNITRGVISGIDAAFYTDEEKVKDIRQTVQGLQDQYGPRSISRRGLAFGIFGVFLMFALSGLAFIWISLWLDTSKQIQMLIDFAAAFYIGSLTLTAFIFFFGYYGLGHIGKKLRK